MSLSSHDLVIKSPIPQLYRSTTAASGVVDTLNASRVLVWARKGARSGQSSAVRLQIRHASASTTLFASGTAFSTPISAIQATASATGCNCNAFDIDMTGIKRYLICKMSGTQSTNVGIEALLLQNTKVPPPVAAITANSGTDQQGFLTITRVPAGP
jgi:hypothetical protein